MPVNYQKIQEPKQSNCYEIIFNFEHGDADSSNSYALVFDAMSEEQLVRYINKATEIYQKIEDSHSSGKTLPRDFENTCYSDGFYIPVELDDYAKMHMSGYYASTTIMEIFYYNNQGEKFEVSIT